MYTRSSIGWRRQLMWVRCLATDRKEADGTCQCSPCITRIATTSLRCAAAAPTAGFFPSSLMTLWAKLLRIT
jgi:hypothetical protein